MATNLVASGAEARGVESSYAWWRLVVCLGLSTLGGVSMWSVVVILPAVQAEFGVVRADASLPYTLVMLGSTVGGILMGRLSDRFGVIVPIVAGTISLSLGYILASAATSLWQFAIIHGVLIGFLGGSSTFGPLVADISHWFDRRRGIAVSLCACGNYLSGTLWPPVVQHFVETAGWRPTYLGIGLFCLVTMLPLALALRQKRPVQSASSGSAQAARESTTLGIPGNVLQTLLMIMGLACCMAMAMPQVHIVAYCGDLGYGAARGAEMLSLMLGFGVVSRIACGWITDKIGPLPTLLISSTMQALSLLLYLPFDGLASLYLISVLFGLFQGGIVPTYAILVRQYFPAGETGFRVGLVLSATLAGMLSVQVGERRSR